MVCLGEQPRWLRPDIGRRQFYRIVDTVLAVGDEHIPTTGTLAPHAAVPLGAIVVAFSTLLDTQFALALIDLRKRGHVVVVVDVLRGTPFRDGLDPTLARMWHLERATMYRDMAAIGVDIVPWPEDVRLDQVMRLLPEHRRSTRVRR
ncbi:putative secreted protein [Mycobacteroides abscessus subsp. abscessus]|nr:putative secreted protein [Mycobacteroides abscessus subsp. abscessus]